jgi:2-phosphosulfolactate phosphatase
MICAWIAEKLVQDGYKPEDEKSSAYISRWHGAPADAMRESKSADYLRRSGQVHDLEFVVHHIDDLDIVPVLIDGKLERVGAGKPALKRVNA